MLEKHPHPSPDGDTFPYLGKAPPTRAIAKKVNAVALLRQRFDLTTVYRCEGTEIQSRA